MPRTSIRFAPVEIPINVSVSRSKGYVYYNTTTEWVPMKSDPQKKHATHKKVIIGKALIVGENWKTRVKSCSDPVHKNVHIRQTRNFSV